MTAAVTSVLILAGQREGVVDPLCAAAGRGAQSGDSD